MTVFVIIVAGMIISADLGIKYYIEKHMKSNEERRIWKGKAVIRKVHNRGMILNALDKHPKIVKGASLAALGILLIWQAVVMRKQGHTAEKVAGAMIAGGAVSNTWDRLKRGYVVDYLAFETPHKKLSEITYNLGDFAIFGGALLMVLGAFLSKEK